MYVGSYPCGPIQHHNNTTCRQDTHIRQAFNSYKTHFMYNNGKDISHEREPIFSNFIDGTPMKPSQIIQLHEAAKRMSLFGAMRDRPYVFPFQNVILDPETGEVNGQNVLHMGQRYKDGHITFHEVPYQWFSFWSNLGNRDNARWSIKNHTAYRHNADTAALDWYADECWRHVYTNDGNGFPIFGAIEDLVDSVKRGHRVRVRFDDQAAEVSNLRVKGDVVAGQLLQEVTRVGGYGADRTAGQILSSVEGVGGTVDSESALKCAGALPARVRVPPPIPWPDGGPESLRSPCCGLAEYKKPVISFTRAILA
ncbi:disintegrin and metalloproteinase domain-containing protein 10 [Plakobranchus ocellatus]|uniref:Disintegrin and metalloproteinase domain-containing protein 10 n=1 Tax=Plakobranchus ocellatus TaxID=259542 RepID=A0AAV3ZRR6_9GAST|nr:disintegrin and metalloproteinase domain-containing protein 10 [Plakobranchus ocellatus]